MSPTTISAVPLINRDCHTLGNPHRGTGRRERLSKSGHVSSFSLYVFYFCFTFFPNFLPRFMIVFFFLFLLTCFSHDLIFLLFFSILRWFFPFISCLFLFFFLVLFVLGLLLSRAIFICFSLSSTHLVGLRRFVRSVPSVAKGNHFRNLLSLSLLRVHYLNISSRTSRPMLILKNISRLATSCTFTLCPALSELGP